MLVSVKLSHPKKKREKKNVFGQRVWTKRKLAALARSLQSRWNWWISPAELPERWLTSYTPLKVERLENPPGPLWMFLWVRPPPKKDHFDLMHEVYSESYPSKKKNIPKNQLHSATRSQQMHCFWKLRFPSRLS